MINIIEYPFKTAFSRKPMLVLGECVDSSGERYGEKMQNVIVDMDPLGFAVGNTITITVTENGSSWQQVFTAAATPTAIDEIPTLTGSWITKEDEYFYKVTEIIFSHPFLAAKLTASGGYLTTSGQLRFFSKSAAISIGVSLSGVSLINYVQTNYVPDNTPVNYNILIEVFLEKGFKNNDFFLAGTANLTKIVDGRFTLDLGEILHGALIENMYAVELPFFAEDKPDLARNQRRYYIRYSERSGIPLVQEPFYFQEPQVVFRGGDTVYNTSNFFTSLDATNSILNNYPNRKIIDKKQPEWLAWINYFTTKEGLKAEIKQYDADNTLIDATIKTTYYQLKAEQYEVILYPTGYTQLGLLANCKKYSIQLLRALDNSEVAPIRTFYIDDIIYDDTKYLHYLNSFGIPELLRCKGHFSKALQVDRNITESYLSGAGYYGFENQTDETQDTFFVYRTGFISEREKDVLQEMLIYNQVWEVRAEGALGISIVDTKFKVYETWENLKSYEINCKVKAQERNYFNTFTEPIYKAWLTEEGGFWLTNDNQPWLLGE